MPELTGLLLAAGGSRRLGYPKQLLQIDGRPLIRRQVDVLAQVCGSVVVVLGAHAHRLRPLVAGTGVRIADNPDWASGMASSLRAGIRCVPAVSDGVMVLLCDQFRVCQDDLLRLREAWASNPQQMTASTWAGGRGAPAIFPRSSFAGLELLRGEHGARRLLEQNSVTVHWVELPAAARDIDTPADLETPIIPPQP